MTLFAIGDLHLPGGEEKPMDIFGDHWENHFAHIAADWRARVKDGDAVQQFLILSFRQLPCHPSRITCT